ncbi:MAG: hypothetical protein UV36_C0021G0003 [Parcubacteria group bacterium GW2011_GWC2_42_6]|nr:MAG: hypothetical protein UV36_C0021G0003 [Parcubacteria group bacterium GW2011_GWC2_42_6]
MAEENPTPKGCEYCANRRCSSIPHKTKSISMAEFMEPLYQRFWRAYPKLMRKFVKENPACQERIREFSLLYPETTVSVVPGMINT